MKFSQRKKAKIRKYRQRRINSACKDIVGSSIYYLEERYEVIDKTNINGVIYLLVQNYNRNKRDNDDYYIFKAVEVFDYVKLSSKRILQNKKAFSNHQNWSEHSTIEITDDGIIKSVKLGSIFGPYNKKHYGPIIIRIFIEE